MIRLLGKLLGLTLAGIFSPTWYLMGRVLNPYLNLHAVLLHPQTFPSQLAQFQTFTRTHPVFVMGHLLPALIAILLLSIAIMITTTYLCGWLSTRFEQYCVHSRKWVQ